jgi:hypothetical protein
MDTTNHPLIGRRIEYLGGKGTGGVVAYLYQDGDGDPCALVITDTGNIKPVELGSTGWRVVTPEPTATAAPEPDDDGWIPLDGTRFPDVEPGASITIKCRGGDTATDFATTWRYTHNGRDLDIIAWRRA